jgi:hypothetical protein
MNYNNIYSSPWEMNKWKDKFCQDYLYFLFDFYLLQHGMIINFQQYRLSQKSWRRMITKSLWANCIQLERNDSISISATSDLFFKWISWFETRRVTSSSKMNINHQICKREWITFSSQRKICKLSWKLEIWKSAVNNKKKSKRKNQH